MTIYLDHAATTPMRAEALEAWTAAAAVGGNAASVHRAGQAARRLLEESREQVAEALDCDRVEVVFTSGGTESINAALTGLWRARPAGRDAVVLPDGEHHATFDTVEWLHDAEGAVVRPVELDGVGRIPIDRFAAALDGAAVATALAANNEVGTVNDVPGLAAAAAASAVPLHVDAVAAFGHLPVSFRRWRGDAAGPVGLCALSVSAHKIGGPLGVGALVVGRAATPVALLHGGGQQRNLRPGTEDVPGAAAFAAACVAAEAEREAEAARLTTLRRRLVDGILGAVPQAQLLGDPDDRVPGNAHLLFPGALGETLLFLLDEAGVCASTGSACQAGIPEPSHVVTAMGRSALEAREVLRFTLGRTTTADEVEQTLRVIGPAVERARAAASARPMSERHA